LTLKEDIAQLWEEELPPPQATQTSKHGGRVEQRWLWVSGELVGFNDWPHLEQVCRLERRVSWRGRTRNEVAYGVTSLPKEAATAEQLLGLWRGHWGIENRVHWVRDVTFDEDRCQVRSGAAPQVLAALRNLVISLVRKAGHRNVAAALRRHAAHPAEALALVGILYPSKE
jgi:hypothetical protein